MSAHSSLVPSTNDNRQVETAENVILCDVTYNSAHENIGALIHVLSGTLKEVPSAKYARRNDLQPIYGT